MGTISLPRCYGLEWDPSNTLTRWWYKLEEQMRAAMYVRRIYLMKMGEDCEIKLQEGGWKISVAEK